MSSIRSSFPKSPKPALSLDELERLAKAAWRARGVAIIWPDKIIDPFNRQAVVNAANELYGKRSD